MKTFLACVLVLAVPIIHAEDAVSRHNEGGSAGSNGVKQLIAIKLNKLKIGKDSATIQIDLGDERYASNKPSELIAARPVIMLTLGSVPTMTGTANAKGHIVGEQFNAKLIAGGKGMRITIKRQSLTALLSDLSGKGEHAFMTITIQDNHPPHSSEAQSNAVEARHAGSLFSHEFELDVQENTKTLIARGG